MTVVIKIEKDEEINTEEVESYFKQLRDYLESLGDNKDKVDIMFEEILEFGEDILTGLQERDYSKGRKK